jgi:hypothetical protein
MAGRGKGIRREWQEAVAESNFLRKLDLKVSVSRAIIRATAARTKDGPFVSYGGGWLG